MSQSYPATKLLPCPFCNGPARLKNGGLGNWFAQCDCCMMTTNDVGYEHAIDLWNTRASQPATPTGDESEAEQMVIEANNSLYGSQGYFHSLDGGPFDKYHLARGIENLKSRLRDQPSCDKIWHTIAKEIACEEDCQKYPNGCGCAQKAADAVLALSSPKCSWPNCDQPSGHDYCYSHCLADRGVAITSPGREPDSPVGWGGHLPGKVRTMSFHPDSNLPNCMMPDGGECCAGHAAVCDDWHKQQHRIEKLESECDRWAEGSIRKDAKLASAMKEIERLNSVLYAYVGRER